MTSTASAAMRTALLPGSLNFFAGFSVFAFFVFTRLPFSAFEYFWNDFGSSRDNLVFVNCSSANYGGAIYASSGSFSVDGCSFVNCSTGLGGGAIYSSSVYFTVDDCSFVGCNGKYGGGSGYSKTHKGSSTILQNVKKGTSYPATGEIDLMKYAENTNTTNFYDRVVASEEDVKSLIWVGGLKL